MVYKISRSYYGKHSNFSKTACFNYMPKLRQKKLKHTLGRFHSS